MLIQTVLISLLFLVNTGTSPVQDAPEGEKSPQFKAVDPAGMIGKPIPSIQVEDLDGNELDLSKLTDELMVLEFTLPSCRFAQRLYIQKKVQPLIRRWG